MNKIQNQVVLLIKKDLGLFLSISFGVFLFLLFFQPFPLTDLDLNSMLIFKAGLAAIVFLLVVLIRIIFSPFISNYAQNNHEANLPYITGSFLMVALCTTAFAFYLRYVGGLEITFYSMFKVLIICLAPPIVLYLSDYYEEQKQLIILLEQDKKLLQEHISKTDDVENSKLIEFVSDYKSENLSLRIDDIVMIKSADNYVEVVYKEGLLFKKHMLRNTLRNIEQLLKMQANFIRCHRICIVNTNYIEKLNKSLGNYSLLLKEYDEQIPVSRQYLLQVKERI
jgi:hypothetical protein